jgi:ubiquinone/menaquinone biosynthesis C-methylase UbiE
MLRPLCTGRVVGLDFSEGMLAEARRRMMPTGAAQVQWERGDVLQLTYERAFDVVTCFGAFGHIPRAREPAFAAGILRALRPGGLFAFVSFSMPRAFTLPWLFGRTYNAAAHLRNLLVRPAFLMFYLTFTLDQARELLARSGFAVEVVRDILPAPYQRGALVLARRPK